MCRVKNTFTKWASTTKEQVTEELSSTGIKEVARTRDMRRKFAMNGTFLNGETDPLIKTLALPNKDTGKVTMSKKSNTGQDTGPKTHPSGAKLFKSRKKPGRVNVNLW